MGLPEEVSSNTKKEEVNSPPRAQRVSFRLRMNTSFTWMSLFSFHMESFIIVDVILVMC